MQRLVTAGFTSAISKDAPGEIVYIPVGENKINATVGGKPGEITVKVPAERGLAIAAALQSSLEKRLSSTVRPRLAFDHQKTGPASGHPKSFRFDPEKGIILALDWSSSGKTAIEGGDYGYFSPTFYIGDDGIPAALPEKGEIGSLVDEPAFRTIGLIAASDSHQETTTTPAMKLLLAKLAIDPAHENAESSAIAKVEAMASDLATVKASNLDLTNERDVLKAKVEAAEKKATDLETAAKEAKSAGHKAKVEAAVAAGKIAAKDEATRKEVLDLLEASETLGDKFIEGLPVKFDKLDQPVVTAAGNVINAEDKFKGKSGQQLLEAALAEEFEAAK